METRLVVVALLLLPAGLPKKRTKLFENHVLIGIVFDAFKRNTYNIETHFLVAIFIYLYKCMSSELV